MTERDKDNVVFNWCCEVIYLDTANKCMAGNNTQCFNLEQYTAMYEKGELASAVVPMTSALAEKHLRLLESRGYVRELKSGVWTVVRRTVRGIPMEVVE